MTGWVTATIKTNSKEGREEELLKELLYLEYNDGDLKVLDKKSIGCYRYNMNMRDLLENVMKKGEQLLVIEANNTTDSGDGTLYEKSEEGFEQIDKEEGVERANAYDVVAYFKEEYEIDGYARMEA